MTNFVEGLVLRAAGLPPSAAAAPRTPPAGERLDGNFTSEEVIVAPAVPERRMVTPPPTERVVVHERAPLGSPREVADRIVEMREIDTPGSPVVALTPQQPAPPHVPVLEERVLETEREVVIVSPPAAPPVTHIEATRTEALPPIRPANREVAMPPTERAPDDERPEILQAVPAPVVLQPQQPIVVVDGTRTVVQPIREERVIVTTQSILIEPAPLPDARVRVEPAPVLATTDRKREESPERDEEGAPIASLDPREPIPKTTGETAPASEREEPPPPRTVVMPQTKSAQGDVPLLSSPESPAPPVSIRIGTIEIRAAAPPPPPPAPEPAVPPPSPPDVPSGFDDYARIRRYAPEAW